MRTQGVGKTISDIISVFEIQALPFLSQWYLVILGAIVFPIPMFYVFQTVAPDDPVVIRRLLAGTLIFGIAFNTAMLVGQAVVAQRFLGNLKLIITMPVLKVAYVLGTFMYTSVTGAISAMVLLAFGLIVGVDVSPTWALAPVLVLTALSAAGIVLFIESFAPSLQVGNIVASLVGTVLVIISPVYFTIESAPLLLRWLGVVSPFRYAADGIAAALSGRTDIMLEIGVLAAYAIVAMGLGIWRLPWRED